MSLVESIIEQHLIDGVPKPGEIVTVKVDNVYLQDGNTPTIASLYKKFGLTSCFDISKIHVFVDHGVLSASKEMTTRLREADRFVRDQGFTTHRSGEGISHVVAIEQGICQPQNLVVATDSHTCTGGVVQSLALGMGASDILYAMLTGTTWLRVPETVHIRLNGIPKENISPKDLMLALLAKYGQEPFLYKSIEWSGDYFDTLNLDQASTIANMVVEMGAKCTFLPPGKKYALPGMKSITSTLTASEFFEFDMQSLKHMIALPGNPNNSIPISSCAEQKVDFVFVGSCANGRYDDLEILLSVMKKGHLHPGVQLVITPASLEVYKKAIASGIITALMDKGALITPPGCGGCVGTQGPIPGDGDVIVSTMNRNFIGRMGNRNSQIFLSSPYVAGYAAILGRLPKEHELLTL